MNYKIPLMNLVSRGHLQVKNVIATENFIKNLDNDSCGTILENLLFNVDSRDCARRLDSIMECYELRNNIRIQVKESTLNNARDKILMEDSEQVDPIKMFEDADKTAKMFLHYLKIGSISAAIFLLVGLRPEERKMTIKEIEKISPKTYAWIRTSPIFKRILPADPLTIPRVANKAWTFGKSKLELQDKLYLNRLKRYGKNTALVAGGIITAIIAGTLAYRKLFSFEAKKCKGLSGKNRTICMCNAVITAAEDAKKKSEEMLLNCDQAKDPQECRYKMKVEIRSWMRKIEEQKRKLAKLQDINVNAYPVERPKQQEVSKVNVGTASDPFGTDKTYKKEEPTNNLPTDPFSNPFA